MVGDQTISIPGSKRGEDGIYIPADQLESHFGLVAAGHQAERTIAALRSNLGREIKAAREQASLERTKVETLLGELSKIMGEPDDQKAFAVFAALKKNWGERVAKAEADALRKRLEDSESGLSARELDDRARALVPELEQAARRYVREYAQRPEYQGVDPQRIYRQVMRRYFDDVFTEDEAGTIAVHPEIIEELMREEAAILARGRAHASTLAAAAKKNQAAVAPQAQAGGKKGAAPSPGKPPVKEPTFSSSREAIAHTFGPGWKDL